MTLFALLLSLWLFPLAVFVVGRRRAPAHIWCATGVSFGLIASPASMGLYGLYWIAGLLAAWIGRAAMGIAFIGIGGVMLAMFHGAPGFHLATALGLRDASTVVHGVEQIYIEAINAVVWSLVYGTAGFALDLIMSRRRSHRGAGRTASAAT
jgi:hypothetical protein